MGRFRSTILLGALTSAAAAVLLLRSTPLAAATDNAAGDQASAKDCAGDNGGITLPARFCATVFADHIGHARHLVVAPNGRNSDRSRFASAYGQAAGVPIQAGVSAILAVALGPATTGSARMADVAIGAAVGLLFSQILPAPEQSHSAKTDWQAGRLPNRLRSRSPQG